MSSISCSLVSCCRNARSTTLCELCACACVVSSILSIFCCSQGEAPSLAEPELSDKNLFLQVVSDVVMPETWTP